MGNSKITGDHNVDINGKAIRFMKACVATKARPKISDIERLVY